MSQQNKYLLVVTGPTASGKTALSVELAKYFKTEILSADSRQFYREIPIGTAAPEEKYLSEVKHHFIGHLSVRDEYDVSKYEKDALRVTDKLFARKEIIILTGGSGLYIDAVCRGFDDLPDPDKKIRERLILDLEEKGIEYLQRQLKQLDPEFYEEVDLKNPKRVLRALEICLQTGRKYSELRKNKARERDFKVIKIGLTLPRQELYRRINLRTEQMLKKGWIEEAKAVYPLRTLNALNTVGFKELFAWMDGIYSFDEAVEKIKTNTRRYAKRQMTWFKRDRQITWFAPEEKEKIISFTQNLMEKENP